MPLNKEDPEIIELARRSSIYDYDPKKEEVKLRCIRCIMFNTYLNPQGIKDKFLERRLSADNVDEALDWLVDNEILKRCDDGTHCLTADFAKLMIDNMSKPIDPPW